MKNLMETIRTMYEAPEDMQPASPDEGKMAYAQCEFIEYASEEICDYIENGGNFPEWFQNKLTKAHEVMKDLHSYMEGEKRASGTGQDPEEMDESVDLEEKKTLAASVLDTVNRAMDADDMDPVNQKALKKDFKDRKDKDIDNDGDVDKSDKYLHNRRKTISKKIKATEAERNWKPTKEGKEKIDVKPKLGEELELDEAKITHADESSPGKGKRMTDLTKSQHMDAADHHDREQMIAYKKKQSWNEKHHAMMAKAHRMHAQGVGSSMMHKEEVDIYEAVTVKLRGGKVPVGQHKFIYKVDKSPKYIENSIKERDKNAKVEVKGKDVHVTASAGAHSSFIDSLRKFRANGTVTEEIQMDDMNEGTMSRYELIKKAAQKVNKDDAKAARDAAKGIKKDKDLKKVKKDPADMDEANVLDRVAAAVHKVVVGDKQEKPAVVTAPAKKPAPKSKMKPLMPAQHESVEGASEEVITEGNAAMELKKYANSKGGIDKQDFIAISNMIAKKKSAKDLAMVLKAQDTDPRDKALEIISKNDNKLYHEILKAARGMMPKKTIKKPNLRAQYEEVELEEKVAAYDKNGRVVGLYKDMATAKKLKPNHTYKLVEDYKKDAKDAPFEADPEKKKKQKNSDGTETSPMSKAKQLAKKGMVSEAEMTPAQKRKREEIVKGMKDKASYFERKYGDRAKDVMYATATKMAMKEGFELTLERFKAGMAVPSDAGPDGGMKKTTVSPPTKTTSDGKKYSPPTTVRKEGTETSVADVNAPVAKPKANGTVNKVADERMKKQQVGLAKEDAAYDAKVAATSKAYVDKKAAPDSIAAPINKVRSTMKGSSERKAMSAYNKVFGKK